MQTGRLYKQEVSFRTGHQTGKWLSQIKFGFGATNLLDFRQRAVDANGIGNRYDALCGKGAMLVSSPVSPDATQLVSGEVDARQPACDARAERLGDQLETSGADVLGGRVQGHDLAVLVAADGGKDGAPALVSELVASEIDGRQCGIDTKGVGNSCDALCSVGAMLVVVVSPDATELVVGEVDARQRACDGDHSSNCVCSN